MTSQRVELVKKKNVKNVHLLKISLTVQSGGKMQASLCAVDSIQVFLKYAIEANLA